MADVRLIVGLGNPGSRYDLTRHNAGAGFVAYLAGRFGITLRDESRFKGRMGRGEVLGHDVRMLVPTTYMNLSGSAVAAVARFYKLAVDEILVAYDEMAFEPGVLRLKAGGGDNGHNGVRSVISQLGNAADFLRLRIGVGHPGDRGRVEAYLTSERMPEADRRQMEAAWRMEDGVLAAMLAGDLQAAMNALHAPEGEGDEGND
ncbi:MAG: aminoacyl-tRNA hydrolase [Pseudomonadales bacterium]|nr:aminoacyl-tRNA hydrolase [Pseudomonadales bacterium]NIX09507.1 aminoacyl-tRNA hydrolase [Pseudomonadales bacterium]